MAHQQEGPDSYIPGGGYVANKTDPEAYPICGQSDPDGQSRSDTTRAEMTMQPGIAQPRMPMQQPELCPFCGVEMVDEDGLIGCPQCGWSE